MLKIYVFSMFLLPRFALIALRTLEILNSAATDQHRWSFLENLLLFWSFFVAVESFLCSFSPANFSNRCRFMCVNSTSLGFKKSKFVFAFDVIHFAKFFLVSSAQFHDISKGFFNELWRFRDFHSNSSLQFRLLGLMIVKTQWNLIKIHPFEDANDTQTSWKLSKGFHLRSKKVCE